MGAKTCKTLQFCNVRQKRRDELMPIDSYTDIPCSIFFDFLEAGVEAKKRGQHKLEWREEERWSLTGSTGSSVVLVRHLCSTDEEMRPSVPTHCSLPIRSRTKEP
mmetsp:Transcript_28945/g.76360  ORF Transcript_28945/g.76360 Transcript_28945/m.76360 type:complete len:105 (-) Transcript_28945:294-608(-)